MLHVAHAKGMQSAKDTFKKEFLNFLSAHTPSLTIMDFG
jgi:hypothetical protein